MVACLKTTDNEQLSLGHPTTTKQKEMKVYPHKISLILLMTALLLPACQEQEKPHQKVEPAHIEHIEGSEVSRLILTEKAVERLGIETVQATEEMITRSEARPRITAPYSALLYDVQGRAWVYTNPEPSVYIRQEVEVDFIEGSKAALNEGPPPGARIVSVGAAELYGTEYEVGH